MERSVGMPDLKFRRNLAGGREGEGADLTSVDAYDPIL